MKTLWLGILCALGVATAGALGARAAEEEDSAGPTVEMAQTDPVPPLRASVREGDLVSGIFVLHPRKPDGAALQTDSGSFALSFADGQVEAALGKAPDAQGGLFCARVKMLGKTENRNSWGVEFLSLREIGSDLNLQAKAAAQDFLKRFPAPDPETKKSVVDVVNGSATVTRWGACERANTLRLFIYHCPTTWTVNQRSKAAVGRSEEPDHDVHLASALYEFDLKGNLLKVRLFGDPSALKPKLDAKSFQQ